MQWIETAFPTAEKRATYIAENDLENLPLDLEGFPVFFAQRKQRIRTRLIAVLGAASAENNPRKQ